jgi:glutamine amidotransferase-like uncharacterized protein
MLAPPTRLRAVLFSDPNCKLEFTNPEHSAIVWAFRKSFGSQIVFDFVDAKDVRSGRAFESQPHIFILPGIKGEISYFTDVLGDAGNERIRIFVKGGGLFFGICAGAYYAASRILFQPEWGEKRERDSGILALDEIHAIGPVKGYCAPGGKGQAPSPEGLNSVDAIPVIICNQSLLKRESKLAYGLGPMFNLESADPRNVDVLLRYNIEDKPPAIVHVKNIGRGSAILSGVLPQYEQVHPPQDDVQPRRLFNLLNTLYQEREGQDFVWNRQLMPLVSRQLAINPS